MTHLQSSKRLNEINEELQRALSKIAWECDSRDEVVACSKFAFALAARLAINTNLTTCSSITMKQVEIVEVVMAEAENYVLIDTVLGTNEDISFDDFVS